MERLVDLVVVAGRSVRAWHVMSAIPVVSGQPYSGWCSTPSNLYEELHEYVLHVIIIEILSMMIELSNLEH